MVMLGWARELQAIAQSGLAWEPKEYDAERYTEVRRIAAEMLAEALARLHNDPQAELAIAAEEQRKITRLRLAKLTEAEAV